MRTRNNLFDLLFCRRGSIVLCVAMLYAAEALSVEEQGRSLFDTYSEADASDPVSTLPPNCPTPRALNATTPTSRGTFSIEALIFHRKNCAGVLEGSFWDPRSPRPPFIIAQMSASIDGKDLEIPYGAFSDLGEPLEMFANASGDEILVQISGATQSRWTALLTFRNGRLENRKVYMNGFENEFFQETSYRYIEDRGQ